MELKAFSEPRGNRIPGLARVLYRVVWLILVGLLLATFAAAVPVRFRSLVALDSLEAGLILGLDPASEAMLISQLGSQEVTALESLGLSPRFYGAYILFFELALTLSCAVVGAVIFWRRSQEWLALWVSLIVVLLGITGPWPEIFLLSADWPAAIWVAFIGGFLGMVSQVHLLFMSPDGQFVPGWTRPVAAGFTGGLLGTGLYLLASAENLGLLRSFGVLVVAFVVWFVVLGLGVSSQVYRYRRLSDLVQRQQTKWVAAGLTAIALGLGLNALSFALTPQPGLPRLLLYLLRTPIVAACLAIFPIGLGFAILRYRLWDIDLIIRRTLIYGALTVTLALIYFLVVILLQRLLPAQNQLATVLSTLTIAAVFSPLRRRIQTDIDRLFYRKRYSAEQTLAAFNATIRQEVDLERLSGSLLAIVDETMQPEGVSIWLKAIETTPKQ